MFSSYSKGSIAEHFPSSRNLTRRPSLLSARTTLRQGPRFPGQTADVCQRAIFRNKNRRVHALRETRSAVDIEVDLSCGRDRPIRRLALLLDRARHLSFCCLNTGVPGPPSVFHLAIRTRPTVSPCPVETANRGNPPYPHDFLPACPRFGEHRVS